MLKKYLFKKEWFLKSREKHFRTQKFTLFTFFKYLLDTHFQKQLICWQLLKLQKYKFYLNFIEPKIQKISSTYNEVAK